MKKIFKILVGLMMICSAFFMGQALAAPNNNGVIILCYHDVGPVNSIWSVTPERLEEQFKYFKTEGYHMISLEEYLKFCRGEITLPEKSILLSFDDGYKSFYTEVFPLLKKYNYPAMMAIIATWPELYSDSNFAVSWSELKTMEESGLVTIASHSADSHRYQVVNPQGDVSQMLESFKYENNKYESLAEFKDRVKSDYVEAQNIFKKNLGHKVTAMVWPFGAYNEESIAIGKNNGFEAFFALEGGVNLGSEQYLDSAKRIIITDNPNLQTFNKLITSAGLEEKPLNVSQLDIDMIFDNDEKQFELNLDQAINNFYSKNINTVFLQVFHDADGSGNIKEVYFNNSQAAVKADVFSHVAARLSGAGFKVYAWLPTLGNQWLIANNPEDMIVAEPTENAGWYNRATPFSPVVKEKLNLLVAELMKSSFIDGILFQDDLYMNDFEDYSEHAQNAFYLKTGKVLTAKLLQEEKYKDIWTKLKTKELNELTISLINTAKQYHPYIKTARNIYPTLITEPYSQEWFCQNYQDYLKLYDYTVVMAYPYLEQKNDQAEVWLKELTTIALRNNVNPKKVIFKLQTYDWAKNKWLADKELRIQKAALKDAGAVNFAYYPENVFNE